jgi:hypothetical protein
MLIVLASLGLIRRHRPIDAENSANTSTGTVQFQYWASTGAHTSIGTIHYQQWQIFADDTDEFYRTLEKCG